MGGCTVFTQNPGGEEGTCEFMFVFGPFVPDVMIRFWKLMKMLVFPGADIENFLEMFPFFEFGGHDCPPWGNWIM
jgi:hypothetical protein